MKESILWPAVAPAARSADRRERKGFARAGAALPQTRVNVARRPNA